MSTMRVIRLWATGGCVALLGVASAGTAQQVPQLTVAQQPVLVAVPTGSVTGRIVCSDTQRPARFAEVMLTAMPTGTDNEGRGRGGRGATARTDLDGVFFAGNVPVGDYYATASATGYISQQALLMSAMRPGADPQAALASLPVVHVSASTTATVNLTLDRGAVIAGKLLWDDGSAATGVQVSAVLAAGGGGRPDFGGAFGFGGGGFGSATDDRGQFRLTGLAPGVYLVRATVIAPVSVNLPATFNRSVGITLYAPGKVRKVDATAITLGAGEERGDVIFQIDLRSLHKVSGRISAVSGGVSIGSGTVRLTDSQDPSLTRMGQIASDGSYVLSYVPAGTYTLTVPNAGPAGAGFGGRGGGRGRDTSSTPGVSYQPYTATLTVADGDVAGVNVELTPAAAK